MLKIELYVFEIINKCFEVESKMYWLFVNFNNFEYVI